jgi:hypothetical protein
MVLVLEVSFSESPLFARNTQRCQDNSAKGRGTRSDVKIIVRKVEEQAAMSR